MPSRGRAAGRGAAPTAAPDASPARGRGRGHPREARDAAGDYAESPPAATAGTGQERRGSMRSDEEDEDEEEDEKDYSNLDEDTGEAQDSETGPGSTNDD